MLPAITASTRRLHQGSQLQKQRWAPATPIWGIQMLAQGLALGIPALKMPLSDLNNLFGNLHQEGKMLQSHKERQMEQRARG